MLQEDGWVAIRAAKGPVDVVASKPIKIRDAAGDVKTVAELRYVQVKSTAKSPYERFGPEERQILRELAENAGATAWLVWWPPRRGWRWIPQSDWPAKR
jgi:Holliday junction resolvase